MLLTVGAFSDLQVEAGMDSLCLDVLVCLSYYLVALPFSRTASWEDCWGTHGANS